MDVFIAQQDVIDWHVGLTPAALLDVGLRFWGARLDQYGRIRSLGMSPAELPMRVDPDFFAMSGRFIREAAKWTREEIVMPKRHARFSLERREVCEKIALIANQRLARTDLFSGVNVVHDHGLRRVFREVLAAPEGCA